MAAVGGGGGGRGGGLIGAKLESDKTGKEFVDMNINGDSTAT